MRSPLVLYIQRALAGLGDHQLLT